MKKFFTLCLCLAAYTAAFAQLPDGSTAPNFIAKDLNGRTWNLYDILDSGRPVIIDISASWCGPCWSYHNSGALEDFYAAHGPEGDATAMVFWVEGDAATTLPCIYGQASCVGGTQGNWTTNTPYPMFDNASIASSYQTSYFPTIYSICPDTRETFEIGQASATALWNRVSPCVGNIPENLAKVQKFDGGSASYNVCGTLTSKPVFRFNNFGTAAIETATFDLKWNGATIQTKGFIGDVLPLETGEIAFDQFDLPGTGTLSVEISSINGGANSQPAVATIDYTNPLAIYSTQKLHFRIRTDNGGADIYWAMYDENGVKFEEGGNQAVGENGGGMFPNGSPAHPTAFANNVTVKDTVNVPANGCFTLRVVDGAGNGFSGPGNYKLYDYNNLAAPIYTSTSFSDYDKHSFTPSPNFVGTQDLSFAQGLTLFPNPVEEQLQYSFTMTETADVQLVITDLVGKSLLENNLGKLQAGEQQMQIPVASLSNGVYFLSLKTDKGTTTKKFTKI